MNESQYKILNSRDLVELLHKIRNSGDELSFATCYETDDSGEILNQSTGNWWGMKFVNLYDGECLLVGGWGGGSWHAFDSTYQAEADELEAMMIELFRIIGAKEVCVDMGS